MYDTSIFQSSLFLLIQADVTYFSTKKVIGVEGHLPPRSIGGKHIIIYLTIVFQFQTGRGPFSSDEHRCLSR